MAVKTFSESIQKTYTPMDQRDSDDPATFELQALTPPQLDQAMDGANMDDQGNLVDLSPAGKVVALKHGLKGWTNVDVGFSEANKNKLPWPLRNELVGEVLTMSLIGEADAKNS